MTTGATGTRSQTTTGATGTSTPTAIGAGRAAATRAPGVAAVVNGEQVPLWEFHALLQLNAQTGGVTQTAPSSPAWQAVRARTVRQIVDEALLNAYAGTHGLAVTRATVDAHMQAYRVQSGAGFAASLARLGVSEAQFRRMVTRNLNAQAVTQRVIDAINAPVVRVQVVQIVVPSLEQARAVRAELLHGTDATLLAARMNSDAQLRRLAGQLPPLTRAQGNALYGTGWGAAFALRPGAISAPVRVRDGWAVMQAVERQPGSGLMARSLNHFLSSLRRTARISTYVR